MIAVENVSLIIKKKTILKNINIAFEDGNIYGLAGNNGCGKTMLMKTICGLISPTEGRVSFNDKVIGKDLDYLPDAGIIIENPGFISFYSGMENLMLLAGLKHKPDKEKLAEVMRQVGLDPKLRLGVGKYSLGMRQRLGIAQAIMEDQKILILDEPMNGLDRKGSGEIRKLLLKKKSEGRLIILASHNREDIEILCDKVYKMDAGEIIDAQ